MMDKIVFLFSLLGVIVGASLRGQPVLAIVPRYARRRRK
jgi:hypothetical protein